MIFKGVVAHLLLFVILFMSSFDYNFAHLSTFIGYYLFSLVFVLVFLNQQHRMIVNVSKQMNDIKNGYLNRDKIPKGTSEINELYDEILKLGEDIVRTQNNLENQRNQLGVEFYSNNIHLNFMLGIDYISSRNVQRSVEEKRNHQNYETGNGISILLSEYHRNQKR